MDNKIRKETNNVKLLLGLITGYLLAGTVNKFYSDISWSEALSKKELIFAFAGIAVSLIVISKLRHNKK